MKALLLDLDNTLYAYAPCDAAGREAVFDAAVELLGVSRDDAERAFDAGRDRIKKDLPGVAACHSRLLYIMKMVELLTGRTQPRIVQELHDRYWEGYRGAMRLRPAAKKLIETARAQGVRVVIVTDFTTDVQLGHLDRLGIADDIDAIVTSEEAGVEKPDGRIFALALEKAGCGPGECVMVGDSHTKDVKGAEAYGIKAVHVEREEDLAKALAVLSPGR